MEAVGNRVVGAVGAVVAAAVVAAVVDAAAVVAARVVVGTTEVGGRVDCVAVGSAVGNRVVGAAVTACTVGGRVDGVAVGSTVEPNRDSVATKPASCVVASDVKTILRPAATDTSGCGSDVPDSLVRRPAFPPPVES